MRNVLLLICFLFSLDSPALEEKTLHVEGPMGSYDSWTSFSSSEEINIKKLFDLLSRSPSGERLLKEAKEKAGRIGLTLGDVVKAGDSSLTDTTLIRKFSPLSPEHVIYETRSVVYINSSLSWSDAILDLAHELTHFIYRDTFNPYDENFNAKSFITSTIEGNGGEVHAFLTECKVSGELYSQKANARSNCHKIQLDSGELSYSLAVDLFYHVGNFHESFLKQLKSRNLDSSFPRLKPDKTNFISSAYGVPYPVAALMEYDLVLKKVCENDQKRLVYMQQGPERSLASSPEGHQKFVQTYAARCGSR